MQARVLRSRLHPTRHHSRFNVCIVLVVVWVLLLGWMLLSTTHTADTDKQYNPTQQLQSPSSLEELYGAKEGLWPSSAAAGPSQLLVLSYYSAKASLAARLLMLMGVYAGEAAQLRIGAADGAMSICDLAIDNWNNTTAACHHTSQQCSTFCPSAARLLSIPTVVCHTNRLLLCHNVTPQMFMTGCAGGSCTS